MASWRFLIGVLAAAALCACGAGSTTFPADAFKAEAFQVEQTGYLSIALSKSDNPDNVITAQLVCNPTEKSVFASYKFHVKGGLQISDDVIKTQQKSYSTDIEISLNNRAFPLGNNSSLASEDDKGGYVVELQSDIKDPRFMAALQDTKLLEIKAIGLGLAAEVNREWVDKFLKTCPASFVKGAEKPNDAISGLSGAYTGYYMDTNGKTPFSMSLSARGGHGEFRGESHEPNTTGRGGPIEVGALIHGYVHDDGSIVFEKTYDGSAGLHHTLSYEGRVSDGGKTIEGKWRMDARFGEFRMTRD